MCDERERLIGYVYDECDPAERRAIEDHLEDCGTCRAEIGGLRNVRQDLLAWAVPPHQPIWRPVAETPVVLPWHRQIPAWAMAAAAGVMFLAGAAGGVVTHALVPHEQPATVSAPPSMQMIPAGGVTASQLTEVEQRVVQMMRDELSKRVVPAARVVPASVRTEAEPDPIDDLIAASERRQLDRLSTVYGDLMTQIRTVNRDVGGLKDGLREFVALKDGGGR